MVGAARWDSYAKFYNLVLKTVAAQRQQLFQRLVLSEPLKVYIAGCGSGLDLPYLPAQSAVLGVDFSAKMLKQSAQLQQQLQAQGHPLALTLQQGRAECSGLADSSVDLVLLHLILAVTDQPQALLQEAIRVLKPGGVISIWDKFAPQQISRLRRIADYLSRRLGTTLLLQIDDLLQPHSLVIMQRHRMLCGQMQHLMMTDPTTHLTTHNKERG
ncbi:class I SAM-dependent methyltransferase [Testudinibacter aquarius]|uniref:Class I SAM-dependent methyltransferase n=1 Tax=Testudinibacter aquarius TaxID=1524974 RepID=A0A4R3YFJ6_9PAST|nr:class I SAM-dependent methyltransferase [Testudinibacter aquarius]KAE9527444.1 hypothetical protein A1D24_02050 [Testudinibacter aquarius]TCV89968.1 methyltransferase family protein [Testudinibacter aquarius]TNG92999.1 class I SAM-dependent methyltransferase [Testudinibacter aquarius]